MQEVYQGGGMLELLNVVVALPQEFGAKEGLCSVVGH